MKIKISNYPQLRFIAWNRHDEDLIEEEEALALYERNWCYVDQSKLTENEQKFINHLTTEFGNGVLNV